MGQWVISISEIIIIMKMKIININKPESRRSRHVQVYIINMTK